MFRVGWCGQIEIWKEKTEGVEGCREMIRHDARAPRGVVPSFLLARNTKFLLASNLPLSLSTVMRLAEMSEGDRDGIDDVSPTSSTRFSCHHTRQEVAIDIR